MPTSTSPNTSVWIARVTSSTPLAAQASGARRVQVARAQQAERQRQQRAEQRAERGDAKRGPGGFAERADEARLAARRSSTRSSVPSSLRYSSRALAEPQVEETRARKLAHRLHQVVPWVAPGRQLALCRQRAEAQRDQQRVGEHEREETQPRPATRPARGRDGSAHAAQPRSLAAATCRWPGRRRGSACRSCCRCATKPV